MDNVERYLRLATWGLWGEHKRIVRMELASHIHHKANQYEALGYTPSAAITRALSDLGPPHVVSAGMNGVYTMPNILRNTLLCALLATLGIGNLTSSVAQVVATSRVPIEDCAKNRETFSVGKDTTSLCNFSLALWLNVSSLTATLEAKGVQVVKKQVSARDFTLTLHFPQIPEAITISQDTEFTVFNGTQTWTRELNGDYIDAWSFVRGLMRSQIAATITGLNPISIAIGSTSFTLGTAQQPVLGKVFLFNALFSLRAALEIFLPAQFPGLNIYDADDDWFTSTLEASTFNTKPNRYSISIKNAREGDAFIVASREDIPSDNRPTRKMRYGYLTIANKNGLLEYRNQSPNVRPVEPLRAGADVLSKSGEIIVLRFTGQIGARATSFERVPVADITVEAVK